MWKLQLHTVHWRRLAVAALLAVWLCPPASWAQATLVARESAVKAAFLSKFGSFVDWPSTPPGQLPRPLVIGVIGNDAVAADLEQIIEGQSPGPALLALRKFRDGDSLSGVHILFVGTSHAARVRPLVAAARSPLLVVTEQPDGLRHGGALNFVIDHGRVRFTASIPSAEARGVRLSARLLAVAQHVEGRSPGQ